jgi:hypothetical protein
VETSGQMLAITYKEWRAHVHLACQQVEPLFERGIGSSFASDPISRKEQLLQVYDNTTRVLQKLENAWFFPVLFVHHVQDEGNSTSNVI